jgi:formamidopyrimidine-DNA glycosylase
MPELPEVETVKRSLEKQVLNRVIEKVYISDKRLREPYPKGLQNILKGREITKIERRSKYLLIDVGAEYLVVHLGMSGKILYQNKNYKLQKHDHFILYFEDASLMVFNDARRFGVVDLVKKNKLNQHKLFKHLGIEPLTKDFDGKYLKEKLQNKNIAIKQAIMDAKNLVGVGNIYASESLFRTNINPKTSAKDISLKKLDDLSKNIQIVLKEAIKSGGSTLRDYVRSDGDIGYFQHSFKVYGRENQPCFYCSTSIKRIVQKGRSTFYCPNCQK